MESGRSLAAGGDKVGERQAGPTLEGTSRSTALSKAVLRPEPQKPPADPAALPLVPPRPGLATVLLLRPHLATECVSAGAKPPETGGVASK